MSTINKHISIPKKISTKDDLDFHYLREKGIQYIEELGGSLWTDYNSHDPGITILEMLCYAITDLGMRTELPMNTLLSSDKTGKSILAQFYKASEVFPSKPVTELDYRKLFIDIDGVTNCWLRKYEKTVHVNCKKNQLSYVKEEDFDQSFKLKGLYTLLVDYQNNNAEEIDKVNAQILKKYHANRNLCEDLIEIKKVETKGISVCAQIEVHPEADEEWVHANVMFEINKYLNPHIRFYSIKEMMERGYTSDQIFDGPILENGFIDTQELEKAEIRREIRLSDIMKVIMKIEGVKLIKDITLGYCNPEEELSNPWFICLPSEIKPKLCDSSTFSYFKGVLPLNKNEKQVNIYLEQLQEDERLNSIIPEEEKDFKAPENNYIAPSEYTTIMNDFPETYGIGLNGLAAQATEERKSQAKQLKAYLLFFDQILATYFQHLGKVKEVFSVDDSLRKTYFTQVVKDIKGFDGIVTNYPSNDQKLLTENLLSELDDNISRKNQILDHLLSRFAERFGDYAFLMKAIYGTATDEIVLKNKSDFIAEYPVISSQRGQGFNYFLQPKNNLWDTENVSGVQKRVSRLLGIKNYNRRKLSTSFIEVYPYLDTNSRTVFRWRIKNEKDKIILSATDDYPSLNAVNKELYYTIQQVIQTKEEEVLNASVYDGIHIGNIKIHKSDLGKYSFVIINPEKEENHNDFVIARQFNYYQTVEKVKQAIIYLIVFLKFNFSEEGMFLVEHSLLRPDVKTSEDQLKNLKEEFQEPFLPICTNGCTENCSIDPYSYRVSIILPGYTYRFSNPDFRNYMEQVIKEELPAHIIPKICWVGYREDDFENIKTERLKVLEQQKNEIIKDLEERVEENKNNEELSEIKKNKAIVALQEQISRTIRIHLERREQIIKEIDEKENDLIEFENAYKAYLLKRTKTYQKQPIQELKTLINALNNLNTIYPVGRLLDCSEESESLDGKIILGQTNIGTL